MTSIKEQYVAGGPFDKWLKTVKTCRSRTKCCRGRGYGNIIVRDFATVTFTSSVINKNFMRPSGDELKCEEDEIASELAEKAKKEAEEAAKAKAKAGKFGLNRKNY